METTISRALREGPQNGLTAHISVNNRRKWRKTLHFDTLINKWVVIAVWRCKPRTAPTVLSFDDFEAAAQALFTLERPKENE